jgi:hypothetical protein
MTLRSASRPATAAARKARAAAEDAARTARQRAEHVELVAVVRAKICICANENIKLATGRERRTCWPQ